MAEPAPRRLWNHEKHTAGSVHGSTELAEVCIGGLSGSRGAAKQPGMSLLDWLCALGPAVHLNPVKSQSALLHDALRTDVLCYRARSDRFHRRTMLEPPRKNGLRGFGHQALIPERLGEHVVDLGLGLIGRPAA